MNLDFSVISKETLESINTNAIVLLVPDCVRQYTESKAISPELFQHLITALDDGDFKTNAGTCLLLRHLPVLKASRLFFVGIGDGGYKDIAKASSAFLEEIKKFEGLKIMTISLALLPDGDDILVEKLISSLMSASYEYGCTKTKGEGQRDLKIQLHGGNTSKNKAGLKRGYGIALGVKLARELGNLPGNYATPNYLAETAVGLSKKNRKISAQVLELDEIKALGMGAFMAVTQGSAQAPKFIILEYHGAAKKSAPVVLVGKGLTFDSGGISLKSGAAMDEMKFDMCGAASVLGTFAALGELQPQINVVGLIPSCENLPSGSAVKPGDVVTSLSGQTIEVLNTDAEGRLILCDALTYAEKFQPDAVVDIATLTGACVIALGGVNSGLFSNDEHLQQEVLKAGKDASDLCWPMPMNDEYDDLLKSNFADIANIGGREAGAITAAKFLQRFTDKYRWAHLDIAGTAWLSGTRKGATGRPVPLLVHFLLSQAEIRS